ncbi:hypothetical protein ACC695_39760, partial [Rhizobium ruizarguesonis]
SMAGPKRPEGRISLENIATGFADSMDADYKKPGQLNNRYAVEGTDFVKIEFQRIGEDELGTVALTPHALGLRIGFDEGDPVMR